MRRGVPAQRKAGRKQRQSRFGRPHKLARAEEPLVAWILGPCRIGEDYRPLPAGVNLAIFHRLRRPWRGTRCEALSQRHFPTRPDLVTRGPGGETPEPAVAERVSDPAATFAGQALQQRSRHMPIT